MLTVCGGGAGNGVEVELFAAIRFDWQRNGMSIRALAEPNRTHLFRPQPGSRLKKT